MSRVHRWNIFYFRRLPHSWDAGLPYFGAIHSRRQNEISATVPTPPSQSAANHSKRCVNGRGLGLI
jgi:hypothetical protein